MQDKTILVIGKNGKTGARVQQRLTQLGLTSRGVSRSTQPSFDWHQAEHWPTALAGCHAAYITFQPDLAVPAAEQIMRNFVQAAKAAGLQHLVLLSGRGEDGALRAERIVQESGLRWNIIRASWFAQNFSEGFMLASILHGELALPGGDIPEPFIDIDDIADVAVAALTQPSLHNQLFEVTGPRAMTFAECMQEIAQATGRNIQYKEIPVEMFIDHLQAQGLDEDMQWLMRELFTVVFDGRNSNTMNGVEQALGRPATDFRDYVQKAFASGVWNASPTIKTA